MDSKNTSARDLSNKADAVAKAKDLDERGVPSKEKGVQVEEIEGNAEQNLKLTKEEIKDDLYKRMGITEKMKAGFMPGQLAHLDKQLDEKADRILKLIVDNKNMTYDDAVKKEEEDNKQREEGGITPGENRRKHE